MNELCRKYERDVSHIWMSHVTHMNAKDAFSKCRHEATLLLSLPPSLSPSLPFSLSPSLPACLPACLPPSSPLPPPRSLPLSLSLPPSLPPSLTASLPPPLFPCLSVFLRLLPGLHTFMYLFCFCLHIYKTYMWHICICICICIYTCTCEYVLMCVRVCIWPPTRFWSQAMLMRCAFSVLPPPHNNKYLHTNICIHIYIYYIYTIYI